MDASRPFESIVRGVGPAFDMSLECQSQGVLEYHIIFGMRLVTLLRVIFSYYLTFQLEGCHGSGFEAYLTYPWAKPRGGVSQPSQRNKSNERRPHCHQVPAGSWPEAGAPYYEPKGGCSWDCVRDICSGQQTSVYTMPGRPMAAHGVKFLIIFTCAVRKFFWFPPPKA